MMELIMVIVVMGILSAIVLPRFTGRTEFEGRGFFNQTEGMIRYAQKVAIAHRRNVTVQIDNSTNRICLTYQSASVDCSSEGVIDPESQTTFTKTAPANVSFAAASSFTFTPLGRLTGNTNVSVTVNQAAAPAAGTITIEAVTGYVH